MKITYFANHNVGCRCLATLIAEGLTPVLVVVQQEEAEHLKYDSVEQMSRVMGIAVHIHDPKNMDALLARLRQAEPDILLSVAWRFIFPKEVLDIPRVAAINFHGSYLPRCRGAHPTNWAIISGEKQTGVTVHFLDEGVDTGDIIVQERFPILDEDTAFTVRERQDVLSVELMRRLAGYLRQGVFPRSRQDNTQATTFRKRRPEDGLIQWDRMDAAQVFDFVRALTEPYPGGYTFDRGRKIVLWAVLPVMESTMLPPGTVFERNGRSCVACRYGYIEVLRHGSEPEGAFPRIGSSLRS